MLDSKELREKEPGSIPVFHSGSSKRKSAKSVIFGSGAINLFYDMRPAR
jgi:hypothetical protein